VLQENQTFIGVENTLRRLSQRSVRFQPMADGAAVAKVEEAKLSAVFDELFPELITAADAHRETLK